MKPLRLIMCSIGSSNFQMGFNPVRSYLGDIVVIRTPTTPSTTVVGTPVNTKLPMFQNHEVREKDQSIFWYEKPQNDAIWPMFRKVNLPKKLGIIITLWQIYLKFPVQKCLSNQFFITIRKSLSSRKLGLEKTSIYWREAFGS